MAMRLREKEGSFSGRRQQTASKSYSDLVSRVMSVSYTHLDVYKRQGVDNPRAYAGNPVLLQSLAYFIANEITKRRMISKHTYLNYHDPLTGLLNRNSYIAYLESRPEERLQSLGVVVADINGLKQINERFGHS